jgi:eukaryotic-like serine/threonine-protein kinase
MNAWIPTVGLVVADRYRLVAPLDEGGMGTVWRAEHQSLRSPLAVKLLNPSIANNPEMLERFLREAQSAAALRSTHVVQVFDYGVHDGMPFIAMELLHGQSLGSRLSQLGWLHPRELAWIFTHISRAIAKAHETGITHRDLKPDNIFLVRDGEVELAKVLDFGIAKVADTASVLSQSSGNTQTGTVLGTPYYMSPEQARGNRMVDHRADIWAMGIIAFECITGRLPFLSTALGDLVIKICTQPTPLASTLAAVPTGFDQWFARACHKDPDHRFQSVKELNDALQGVLTEPAAPSVDLAAQHWKKPNGKMPADLGAYHGFGQGSTPPLPTSFAPEPYSAPVVGVSAPKKSFGVAGLITGLLAGIVAITFLGGVAWVALNIPGDGSGPKLPWIKVGRGEPPAAPSVEATSSGQTSESSESSADNTTSVFASTDGTTSVVAKSKRIKPSSSTSDKSRPSGGAVSSKAAPSRTVLPPPPSKPHKGMLDERE